MSTVPAAPALQNAGAVPAAAATEMNSGEKASAWVSFNTATDTDTTVQHESLSISDSLPSTMSGLSVFNHNTPAVPGHQQMSSTATNFVGKVLSLDADPFAELVQQDTAQSAQSAFGSSGMTAGNGLSDGGGGWGAGGGSGMGSFASSNHGGGFGFDAGAGSSSNSALSSAFGFGSGGIANGAGFGGGAGMGTTYGCGLGGVAAAGPPLGAAPVGAMHGAFGGFAAFEQVFMYPSKVPEYAVTSIWQRGRNMSNCCQPACP